jgi:disulfide bond formation protein DsbB
MNRYTAVPWPWLGLAVVFALLVQELVLKVAGGPGDLGLVAWRVATMSLGLASFTLLVLPNWRASFLLGALVCAGLMGFALYSQYGLGYEPCPLCIFQRVAVIACGVVFLLGALHNPGRVGAAIYALLVVLFAGAGAAVAGWHVWVQSLPPDKVPACGPGLSYMMETMPFGEVLATVFKGSGECAAVDWRFLDLSMPAWVLVAFVVIVVVGLVLTRRG